MSLIQLPNGSNLLNVNLQQWVWIFREVVPISTRPSTRLRRLNEESPWQLLSCDANAQHPLNGARFHLRTMQIVTKAIVLLALLRRPAGSWATLCQSPDCLYDNPPPTPACVADGTDGCVWDNSSVKLGVSFTTSKQICVTGVQFYHEAGGNLSSSLWNTATNLTVRTSYTDGSGWLSSTFNPPALMNPGNKFVAAYFAPTGAYAYQYDYFKNDFTVGPVTFKGGANGKFMYGSSSAYPSEGPYRNSSYFVTPVWKPNWSYYVWNATSDTIITELYDGFSGCIKGKLYNIEARPSCPTPSVAFKLYNVTGSPNTVVKRQTEIEAPFFVWGDNVTIGDVFPSRLLLSNGVYQLFTTVGTDTEIITFAQACT
jgi:Domain of unknown function (DUF4082)